MGIEFVNYKGVDKLRSTAQALDNLRDAAMSMEIEAQKKILSNSTRQKLTKVKSFLAPDGLILASLKDLVSYNLRKWQTIPFFIADNEGGFGEFIRSGKVIRYINENDESRELDDDVPPKWQYIWGVNNKNIPLIGKDFETANFTDKEIAQSLSGHIGIEFTPTEVAQMRA